MHKWEGIVGIDKIKIPVVCRQSGSWGNERRACIPGDILYIFEHNLKFWSCGYCVSLWANTGASNRQRAGLYLETSSMRSMDFALALPLKLTGTTNKKPANRTVKYPHSYYTFTRVFLLKDSWTHSSNVDKSSNVVMQRWCSYICMQTHTHTYTGTSCFRILVCSVAMIISECAYYIVYVYMFVWKTSGFHGYTQAETARVARSYTQDTSVSPHSRAQTPDTPKKIKWNWLPIHGTVKLAGQMVLKWICKMFVQTFLFVFRTNNIVRVPKLDTYSGVQIITQDEDFIFFGSINK